MQVIYDENIRLFVSLAKQKSSYHFPNLKKSEFKRLGAAPNSLDREELGREKSMTLL